MLFKVTNKDFFEDNPSASSINNFIVCSSREMKYICLVYDYQSPYRNLKIEERKLKAVSESGFRMEKDGKRPDKYAREMMNGKIDKVQFAIHEFMSMQKDEDRELAEAVTAQLEEIKTFLKRPKETEGEWRIAIQMLEKMPKLLKDRKEIFDILDMRDQLGAETTTLSQTDTPTSTLEMVNAEE
jgi:hypothetical protein